MHVAPAETLYDMAVAIPARSEAQRIEACLSALASQAADGLKIGVFVLCNNCEDDTARRARRFGDGAAIGVHVRETVFDPREAHAGTARRMAMQWARAWLHPIGAQILCSTDADSRVASDWATRLLAAFGRGADAVAGTVAFDPAEAAVRHFPPLRRLEDRYAALQARVQHLVDPLDHDPWPCHIWEWGANFAVTAMAFDRSGGVPPSPLAEDRAFAAQLARIDARIRHSPDVHVFTSARTLGRAPGGLADLVAAHSAGAGDLPCDAALEPIFWAQRRAELKGEVRSAYETGRASGRLLERLGLSGKTVERAFDTPFAGEAWNRIETSSPHLKRERLSLAALPREISRAERLVTSLGEGARGDNADAAMPALWSAGPLSP